MKKRGKARNKAKVERLKSSARPAAAFHQQSRSQQPRSQQSRVGGQRSHAVAVAARLPIGLLWHPRKAGAVPVQPAYAGDERRALALLLLPFLIVAVSLGANQSLKPAVRWVEAARNPLPSPVAIPVPAPRTELPSIALTPLSMPTSAPEILRTMPVIVIPHGIAMPPPPLIVVPPSPTEAAPPQVASLIVPPAPFALPPTAPEIRLPVPPSTAEMCVPAPKRVAVTSAVPPAEFGQRLAEAARAQTKDFVIYSATYKRIAYPMGDIPSLYGACSDLIVRAYRSLGIDLQELVQRARVGGGDPNIDHRRTETLRALFARHGEIVSTSAFPEDYKPGDIVTYYRPFSRVSQAHIAIVSDVLGPSGRPMIVHNRGWGPQLEDALFVDRITGHYRFSGGLRLSTAAPGPNVQALLPQRSPLRLPLHRASTAPVKSLSAGIPIKIR